MHYLGQRVNISQIASAQMRMLLVQPVLQQVQQLFFSSLLTSHSRLFHQWEKTVDCEWCQEAGPHLVPNTDWLRSEWTIWVSRIALRISERRSTEKVSTCTCVVKASAINKMHLNYGTSQWRRMYGNRVLVMWHTFCSSTKCAIVTTFPALI